MGSLISKYQEKKNKENMIFCAICLKPYKQCVLYRRKYIKKYFIDLRHIKNLEN